MAFSIEKTIVVLISVSFVLTAGNDVKDEGDRGAHSDRAGLWFGPRLGKRSLQIPEEDNRDIYLRMLEAADAMRYYYDQLPASLLERSEPDTRVTKKVIFTPKLGRSLGEEEHRYLEFTPRLGRRLSEELAVTPSDMYRGDERPGIRTRYFSPRLGRNMNFSPRLGRELTYDNYPNNVRVARSVNNTKMSR